MASDLVVGSVLPAVRSRAAACFLCKWIAEDLEKNGKLTDWPPNENLTEKSIFAPKAKEIHLALERIPLDS